MKAVILAGGKGTRLKPLTANLPKPLAPILNTPIIDYSLALLARYGISETAVTLQHLPEKIINHLDASEYKDRLYYFMENAPLGTAGSVKNAEAFLDETFIVVSGDALTDINIEKMLSYHRAARADITIAAKRVEDPSQFGVICADSVGRVFGFKEKPKTCEHGDTVSCGIYIIEPHMLQMIPSGTQYDFARDLFPLMLDKRMRLFSYETEEYWCDVGSIGAYFSSNMDALNGRFDYGNARGASVLGGRFIEAEGAAVFTGGNIYIGDGVKLSGGVILGANVSVNSGSVLSNCIIGENVSIPAFSHIENCILSHSYRIDIAAGAEQADAPKDNIIPFATAIGGFATQ